MKPVQPPAKKDTLLQFLARGIAMVHVDARKPGAQVPAQYEGEAHLRLNLSYRYAIPDLIVSDDQVQATLSFGGTPFRCVLPWDCIFGITSNSTGDGQVWPEDLPTEVMQSISSTEETERRELEAKAQARAARPQLEAVKDDGADDAQAEPSPRLEHAAQDSERPGERPAEPARAEPKPRPHLRLVR